jgi:hypothetical protein
MPHRKCVKCEKRAIAYQLGRDGSRIDLCEDHLPTDTIDNAMLGGKRRPDPGRPAGEHQ